MPAFTFEKITPPARRGSVTSPSAPSSSGSPSTNPPIANSIPVKKQRSVIVQIIDRFVEVRTKRSLRAEEGTLVRRDPKPKLD